MPKVDGIFIIYFILCSFAVSSIYVFIHDSTIGFSLLFIIFLIVFYSNIMLVIKHDNLEKEIENYKSFFEINYENLDIIYNKLIKMDSSGAFRGDDVLSYFFKTLYSLIIKHKILLYGNINSSESGSSPPGDISPDDSKSGKKGKEKT